MHLALDISTGAAYEKKDFSSRNPHAARRWRKEIKAKGHLSYVRVDSSPGAQRSASTLASTAHESAEEPNPCTK